MSDKADIWMPLFIGDYLASTSRLTTEQHGAYLLLIMDYWKNGPLPDNDAVLAQIARLSPDAWSNAQAVLKQFFSIYDGHWRHGRIEKELANAAEQKQKNRDRAKAAAQARWSKSKQDEESQDDATSNASSNAPSIPKAMLEECPSPSPSPSPLSTPAPSGSGDVPPPPKRKKRITDDFSPTDTHARIAAEQGVSLSAERDKFVDHFVAKGETKADWNRAFNNWLRNAKSYGGKSAPGGESQADRIARLAREVQQEQGGIQ